MNVTCSACQTQYKIDAAKVPASGGFIKCRTCGERIKIPAPTDTAIPLSGHAPADLPPLPNDTQPISPAAATAGSSPGDDEAPTVIAPRPERLAAIPLAGSSAVDDQAPTVIGPAPVPPPPRAPVHEQETVIAVTPSLPKRGSAIPLEGGAPTSPVKPAAIPLGGGAPASPVKPAAIPLGGSVPASPVKPAATPLGGPPQPEAPTVALPLPSSSASSGEPSLAAKTLESAPLPPADLPQAVAALASDDTMPQVERADALRDLPTAVAVSSETTQSPADLFADLPVVDDDDVTAGAADALNLDLPGRLELSGETHTAVTEIGSGPTFDDLPVPRVETLPLNDDLPTALPTAPSLMDDLPIAPRERQADTDVLELDAEAMLGVKSQPRQPALVVPTDELPPPSAVPAAMGDTEPAAVVPPAAAQPAPRGKARVIVLGVAAGVVVLLSAAAVVTPYLGLQLVDPFGLAAVEPSPAVVPPTPPLTKAKEKLPAEVTPPEVPPVAPTTVLSAKTVDQLDYLALKQAADKLAAKPDADASSAGLLAWARFRLAHRFGDAAALAELQASLPAPAEISKLRGLHAAAAVGGLVRAGKLAAARKLGERLLRDKEAASPQLAYALAASYDKRTEQAKARKELDRAVDLGGQSPDLDLLRGKLLLFSREPAPGVEALTALAMASKDPELRLTVAEQLLAARQTRELGRILREVGPESLATVPPERRVTATRLLSAVALRAGNLTAAAEQAKARAEANPTDVGMAVDYLRLQAYLGADIVPLAAAAKAKLPSDFERGRLLAAEVRLHLARKDLAAAHAALAASSGLAAKQGGGWLMLAEGWIAKQEGKLPAARAAFNAALKGRPKFVEPKVELALLETGKPGVRLKKLSDLEEKGESSWATYHLARLMRERGNPGGALVLYDRVLWTEPTLIDPVALLIEWSDAADAAGQGTQAETTIRALHEARPDDRRPLAQLITLAKRNKRLEAAIEWARVLANKQPDEPEARIGLAAALNDAGRFAEAQKLLDELFKAKPAARTVDGMVELARAWAEREPFRAKDLLQQANSLEPRGTTYVFLGRLEAAREHKDEAKKAFSKALELDPALIEPRLYLARLSIDAGATGEVIDGLERILAQEPGHVEAAVLLGDVFLEQGRPREALKRYELALQVATADVGLLMKVARLQLQRLNQLEAAVRTLRRVVSLGANLAEPHYLLGLAHKDLGAPSLARQEFNTYLRLEPSGELVGEVKNLLRDLESE